MKNKGVTILSIITNIILIAILCSFIKINGSIIKEKQIVKEMSESTQVTDLNNQINALNVSQEEYAKNVQSYKEKITTAITNQDVPTSADATADVVAENIGKILQTKTVATATADNITEGKTAWVNGNLITGTRDDNITVIDGSQSSYYNIKTTSTKTITFNISSIYNEYKNITKNNIRVAFSTVFVHSGGENREGSVSSPTITNYDSNTGVITATYTLYGNSSVLTVSCTPRFFIIN